MAGLPELVGAVIETAMIAVGADIAAPGAGLAGSEVMRYLQGRLTNANAILRSQLERAGATASDFRDAQQLAAVAVRYHRAARDQAADENLRILAEAMVGLARRSELWASDFLKYADILAPLSRDELIFVGGLMAADRAIRAEHRDLPRNSAIWHGVANEMIRQFPSKEHMEAIAARAQRSGMILPISGFDGTLFELSPLGREVREFVDIEAAVRATAEEA